MRGTNRTSAAAGRSDRLARAFDWVSEGELYRQRSVRVARTRCGYQVVFSRCKQRSIRYAYVKRALERPSRRMSAGKVFDRMDLLDAAPRAMAAVFLVVFFDHAGIRRVETGGFVFALGKVAVFGMGRAVFAGVGGKQISEGSRGGMFAVGMAVLRRPNGPARCLVWGHLAVLELAVTIMSHSSSFRFGSTLAAQASCKVWANYRLTVRR